MRSEPSDRYLVTAHMVRAVRSHTAPTCPARITDLWACIERDPVISDLGYVMVWWCVKRTGWRGGSPVVFLTRQGQNGHFICHFVLPCQGRTLVATGEAPPGTLSTGRRRWVARPRVRVSRPSLANPILPHSPSLFSFTGLAADRAESWRNPSRPREEPEGELQGRLRPAQSRSRPPLPRAETGKHEELKLRQWPQHLVPTRPQPR
jgi:hypothetical protein